jgi:ribosome-associated toxin RatA of RatAB toxin-antitoxin module
MKHVNKSVLLWYSPEQMYALVTAVADYPQFLPWCSQSRVVAQHEDGMTAELHIAFAGLRQAFTTRNVNVPNQSVNMTLVDGPFSHLTGQWRFLPLSDPKACKVEFSLDYAFSSAALSMLISPVFERITGTFVDAFVKRAEQVYGPQ